MKSVFYGGGYYHDNLELHREMIRMSGVKSPRITFIPSASDYGMVDFPDFVSSFKKLGKVSFLYFPIDVQISPRLKREALKSEIIFLSGGNTFGFLRNLRKQKLMSEIRTCSKSGTVVSGLSAGGILLTPSIKTATFPKWDCDENFVKIKKLEALDLYNFEFFPHYSHSERYRKALGSYSKSSKINLIAVADGAGIVVDQEKRTMFGKCVQFYKGHVIKV